MAAKLSEILRASLNPLVQEREGLLNGPAEKFDQAAEKRTRDLSYKIDELRDRIGEVEAQEAREAVLGAARVQINYAKTANDPIFGDRSGEAGERRAANGLPVQNPSTGRAYVVSEEPVYRHDDANSGRTSFFRDLYNVTKGDWAAADRLHRNNEQMDLPGRQARALSTGAGVGGQFAPPLWLVDQFVKLARPARVTADLMHHEVLPEGVSSINLPSVATGTTTAAQATQNSALSQTDLTTSSVSSGITTIGGKQVSSLQLLRQSPVPIDEMILGDLAQDYAKQLDQQVIFGTGLSGQLKGLTTWGTAVTWTQAAPVVASTAPATSFQAQLTKIAAAVANSRFAPATSVVMSPERWGWITEAVDSQGRPLVPPASAGGTMNSFGSANEPTAQGPAGSFAGLPVYVDPALTVASGNETVLVLRQDDTWLYEAELTMDTTTAPYADSLGVLFRCFGFVAMAARYSASIQALTGTGLVKVTLG
jgi:HK97 family phage major capsid protein